MLWKCERLLSRQLASSCDHRVSPLHHPARSAELLMKAKSPQAHDLADFGAAPRHSSAPRSDGGWWARRDSVTSPGLLRPVSSTPNPHLRTHGVLFVHCTRSGPFESLYYQAALLRPSGYEGHASLHFPLIVGLPCVAQVHRRWMSEAWWARRDSNPHGS